MAKVAPSVVREVKEKPLAELRMIAWELTGCCNLKCVHCRAAASSKPLPGELTTKEAFSLIDEVMSFSKPVIILTGGEPLLREDVYEVARYGHDLGLRMVMGTNGTLITAKVARNLKDAGIERASISIESATPGIHDEFRKVPGSFEAAVEGIKHLREAGISFQLAPTVTKRNAHELDGILKLALELEAVAVHVFLLVPTGRGEELKEEEIPPKEYEQVLNWLYKKQKEVPIHLKATCAPHYYRILRQRAKKEGRTVSFKTDGLEAVTRGCLGGVTFCFVSHHGKVQPCGYLELDCGNIRQKSFREIWFHCPIFKNLRNYAKLKGKCGVCEYKKVCGGCRARAYALTGDYLEEEPYCVYVPQAARSDRK